MDAPQRQWAPVALVDHCARVSAYYGGAFSALRASLRPPARAFLAPSRAPGAERATRAKKRKREALAALAALGKFVPLDARVARGLRAAHAQLLAAPGGFAPPVGAGGGWEAALGPLERSLVVRGHERALFASGSDRVEIAEVLGGDGGEDQRLVLVPPGAAFAAADVRGLAALGVSSSYEWIVMDPPWENKSVDRGRRYATFRHEQLLRVDVPSAADPRRCVLMVWVTNKPAYTEFLLGEALPYWGFTYHDTWFWLKVCVNGDLVTPLESTHRLPFEKVIVAYRAASEDARLRLQATLGDKTRAIASVPLRHSWKPPPESFFPNGEMAVDGNALELFARELRPNWTSIGLEVLKFQDVALFAAAAHPPDDSAASSSEAAPPQPGSRGPAAQQLVVESP